jgi:DNA-binding SARP family transcriptional activator
MPLQPLALDELPRSFVGRPDLAGLWQRLNAGQTSFTPAERLQITLAEARADERAGRIADSAERARQVLEAARQSGDTAGLGGALAQLGYLQFRLGHYAEATALAAEALACLNDHPDTVTALHVQGLSALAIHDWAQAETHFRQAADLSRQIGYPLGLSLALHNLALIYESRGQFDLALASSAESQRLSESFGHRHWAYPVVRTAVCQTTGRRGETRQALSDLAELAQPGSLVDCLYRGFSAQLALDEDDLERAEAELEVARPYAVRLGDPVAHYLLWLVTSRLRRLQGDAPAAWQWASENLAELRRVGHRGFECHALVELARAEWALGHPAAAEAGLQAALELAGALGSAYVAAQATFLLAALRYEQGQPEAEAAWLEAAQRIQAGGYGFILERERALAFPLLAALARRANSPARAASETLLAQLARVAPLPLRIVGLGRFEVWQARRRIADREWKRRAGELLRFLLLQPGRSAGREAVMDGLWPEQPREAALAQLHQASSALRRSLEPDLPDKFPSRYLWVEADRLELRLPPGSTVDFERFERLLTAGIAQGAAAGETTPQLAEALDLYQGDLFPPDRFADWAQARRERLAELHLAGRLALAQAQLAAGAARPALENCRRILAADPWREDAVLAAMRACQALGDRPGALRLFKDLEHALRADLQLAPRADLRSLAASLRESSA